MVVFCPQKKAIATGDLLHGFPPYLFDAYPLEWPRTLRDVAEFGFQHAAVGHGDVQHTRDRLYQEANFIEELTNLVQEGKQAGKRVEQLHKEILPETLKSLADGAYGEFFSEQSLKFERYPPGTKAADLLALSLIHAITHTYARLARPGAVDIGQRREPAVIPNACC